EFRNLLLETKRRFEQTIDTVSIDKLLHAGLSDEAREQQRALVQSFEEFLAANRDEITALHVLYSRPYSQRLRAVDIRDLAQAIEAPPRSWSTERLWQAYAALDGSKVRGAPGRVMTNIVSLVRFALHQDERLAPFPEEVEERFAGWLA